MPDNEMAATNTNGRAADCAARFYAHGFIEEGATPFDMTVLNRLDRFRLALAAIERADRLRGMAAHLAQHLRDRLQKHAHHVRKHGKDMSHIRYWRWEPHA